MNAPLVGLWLLRAIAELAESLGIASACVTRVLRLAPPALDIVEAVKDGRHGPEVMLANGLAAGTWPLNQPANIISTGNAHIISNIAD